ncbi:MAG TPA: DUF2007 domain-containing protein [Nitrospiraceae bacterium]|nr:DUF2007 domain-containing protein [Nitrospiraceae bacterium]
MVALIEPQDEGQLAVVRSLLDANDIPYYVKNEWFGSLYPGFPLPFNQRVVMVLEDDYVRAEILLRGLRDDRVPPAAS